MTNKINEDDLRYVDHELPFRHRVGNLTVTRGSAWSGPGCHLGCGVLLYTDEEGKLVKVEGDPENPYSKGRLCIRCLNLPETVYHEDRLKFPLKRAREDRGKDTWERITWDEAFGLIERRFKEIKAEHGAESIVFSPGTGRDCAAYITRLAWSFGSPNYTSMLSGHACYAPRIAGMAATTGSFWVADCAQQFRDRYDCPEYRVPETMFIWGNYPLIANSDGFFGHWVIDLMKRGMKIVMIDPKVTWLSNKAVLHLPVRPGCDAALALGMLNVIVNEDLYDHDFVDRWTYGFDELAKRVQEYPPSRVAEITWIPERKIVEAARLLASSKPATLQWGVAVDMTKEAIPAGQAISALFHITGNVDVPGGIIAPPEILSYAGGWGSELLSEEQKAKRIGLAKYPLYSFGFQFASADEMMDAFEKGVPYEMHGAWIQQSNFLACMGGDPRRLYKAFRNLDFVVMVDLFMTPTGMALADVLLPAVTFPERNGIRVGDGVQRAETINKVIEPIGECKSDMEINLELGRRLAPEAWPWETVEEMYTAMLEPTGLSFEELQQKAPAYLPFSYRRYETGLLRKDGKPGFNTRTGRIELWSTFFSSAGLDPLPYFEEPTPGPGSTPELLEEYPLVLTTGARTWSSFHSEHRQIPRLRAMKPEPIVEVHPDVLKAHGIANGDWVWIENHMGRAKRRVVETTVLDPRIIACDHAWWYPESPGAEEDGLYEVWDLNINNLVPLVPGKSGMGANYKTTLVKIYRVEEGE